MNKLLKTYIFLLLILTAVSCGLNEFISLGEKMTLYELTSENDLQDQKYLEKLSTFFDNVEYNYFYGVDSIKIGYKVFPNLDSTKAIVISNGRTESIPKYMELIYDLNNNGYSIYILDHRGQGVSERMYKVNPEMGYVENFNFYVEDLKTFYELVVVPNSHSKIYLLGHSMGGTISTLYVEENPTDFNAVALSSPMYGFSFSTCAVANLFGGETIKYAPTQKGYKESIEGFEKNTLTNSKVRYNLMIKTQNDNVQIQLGGSSYQWLMESCSAMSELKENANNIEIPLLLLQGTEEEIVKSSAHNSFVDKMIELNKDVSAYKVDGAKHELLIEKDELRNLAVSKILEFFEKN